MNKAGLIRIREYARQLHRGQVRKGGEPYFRHVNEVAEICSQLLDSDQLSLQVDGDRFDVLATALLHDSIEDTAADYEDILQTSNPRVAEWVGLLSEDKRKPKPIRLIEYLEVLGSACSAVQAIKLADVYSNVTGITFREERQWIANYLEQSQDVLDKLHSVKNLNLFFECQKAINAGKSKLVL